MRILNMKVSNWRVYVINRTVKRALQEVAIRERPTYLNQLSTI